VIWFGDQVLSIYRFYLVGKICLEKTISANYN
jgi:hypothetical protein